MAKEKFRRALALSVLAAMSLFVQVEASNAQAVSTGKVTTAAPTYVNGTAGALSLDTSGNLRVVSGGAPTGTTDVNIVEVGGAPVTTAVPVVGATTVCDSAGTLPPVLPCADVVASGGNNAVVVTGIVNQGTAGAAWAQNITSIAGVSVGTTVPGALDITCVSGCVAGSGVSQGTATTAAPTYVDATNNPLSLDLAGNLRAIVTPANTTPMFINCSNGVGCSGFTNGAALPPGSFPAGFSDGTNLQVPRVNASGFVMTSEQTAIPAGTNNIGDVDIVTMPSVTVGAVTAGVGIIPVAPSTQAATLSSSTILAASTNATSVKASAGTLFEISVYNTGSTIAWLKLYNSASAPTCGSGTPVGRYMIPGAASGGSGSNVSIPLGKSFGTGIGFCVTTGIADADTGAVAATTYTVNLTYK